MNVGAHLLAGDLDMIVFFYRVSLWMYGCLVCVFMYVRLIVLLRLFDSVFACAFFNCPVVEHKLSMYIPERVCAFALVFDGII